MSLVKLIYEFSLEEFEKFSESTNGIELITDDLLNKFAYFEFDPNLGKILLKDTFTAIYDIEQTKKETETLKDYFSVGSILFSEALFAQKHRGSFRDFERYWYILMFSRLKDLTKEKLKNKDKNKKIKKIKVKYLNKTTKCKECIVLNGENDEFKLTKTYNDNKKLQINFNLANYVKKSLNRLSDLDLFYAFEVREIHHYEINPFNRTNYQIKVQYERKKYKDLNLEFETNLPKELDGFFKYFLQTTDYLVSLSTKKDLFNYKEFAHSNEKDCMFCLVEIHDLNKSYYYLGSNLNISVGNNVIVPLGKDNKITFGTVKRVEYKKEYNAPYPIDKIKNIISVYDGDYKDFIKDKEK